MLRLLSRELDNSKSISSICSMGNHFPPFAMIDKQQVDILSVRSMENHASAIVMRVEQKLGHFLS